MCLRSLFSQSSGQLRSCKALKKEERMFDRSACLRNSFILGGQERRIVNRRQRQLFFLIRLYLFILFMRKTLKVFGRLGAALDWPHLSAA